MLVAVLFAVTMFAQAPAGKAVRTLPIAPVKTQTAIKSSKVVAEKALPTGRLNARRKSAEDFPIISEQPAGELRTYKREGQCYITSDGIYYSTQSGTIDIVFADNNKVYFYNIVSGYQSGAWVEGTLSADGTTITVPTEQNLAYSSYYDAGIALVSIEYSSGFFVNHEVTEITFAIEDDVITLQNTDEDHCVGAAYTDDDYIMNYGDYESVYTPYVPDMTLVTPPAGLVIAEFPMTGIYYASLSDYQSGIASEVNATVQVGFEGNTVYIQGLIQTMPEAWVMGEIDEAGEVTIPVTYLGEDANGHVYSTGYATGGATAPLYMIFDADRMTLEVDGYAMTSSNELENDMTGIYQQLYIGQRPEPTVLPEGLLPYSMVYSGLSYDGEEQSNISGTVNLAFDMAQGLVYVQGLIAEVPDAWIVGHISADGSEITFETGQYIGVGEYGSLYLVGGDADGNIQDVVFDFDAMSNVATQREGIYIYVNGKSNSIYYYSVLSNIVVGNPSDELWIASQQGYQNAEEVAQITIGEGITGVLSQAEGTLTPKYYIYDESLRLYAGNTLVITSEKTIAKIVFTMIGTEAQMQLEASVGEYELDGTVGTWTGEANEITFSVPNISGSQARIVSIQIYYLDNSNTMVEVPVGLETEVYFLQGSDMLEDGEAVNREVLVGFDGNDVYIQGISALMPEAWIKGTMAEDGTVTFSNWYLGVLETYFYGDFDMVFGGAVMHYDEQANMFTCEEYSIIASQGDDPETAEYMTGVTITRLVEVAGTPANPEITNYVSPEESSYPRIDFDIVLLDVDGNPLVSGKVFYTFFIEKDGVVSQLVLTPEEYEYLDENMTEIPYNYSDDWDIYNDTFYLNQGAEEIATWDKIGIQVIYRGGGEEHSSDIVWYNLNEETGLESVTADEVEAKYFDVLGRSIDVNAFNGIVIKQSRMSDGSVKSTKILIRKF